MTQSRILEFARKGALDNWSVADLLKQTYPNNETLRKDAIQAYEEFMEICSLLQDEYESEM